MKNLGLALVAGFILMQIGLVAFKFAGVITLKWLWVLTPILGVITICVAIMVFLLVAVYAFDDNPFR